MIKKKLVTVGLAVVLAMASTVVSFAAPVENPVPLEQSARLEAKLSPEDIQVLSSMFDADFFAKKYPAIAKALGNNKDAMFKYFCNWGVYEGKQCCVGFDVAAYAVAYSDLAKAFGTDVMAYYRHYVSNGKTEGRTFTTVEECQKNGISTKMIEAQRFTLDDNGKPSFVKFYNAEQKAFVYNEAEAKSIPAGTYSDYDTAKVVTPIATPVSATASDTPAQTEKKEEPVIKGFNTAAYQRDLEIWKNKRPELGDYLKEGVYEEYMEAIEEWKSAEPTLENFKQGRLFATEAAALEAYQSEHAAWANNEPQATDFMTEEKATEYQNDMATWNAAEPLASSYIYNNYESEEAALVAYGADYNAWNDRLVAWLDENDKNDYSVGYATQEAAEAAYQQALFDFTVQIYNIDYDTQFKSKTKEEVANQIMATEYSNYMALWTPWYMDKSNALSEWKMQNPTATIDDENAWVQSYLAEHPEPVQPTLEAIKATLVQGDDYEYENELEAGTAYRSTVTENMSEARQEQGAPQSYNFRVGKYATEEEANNARVADIEEYKGNVENAPNSADYWYDASAYENIQAAEAAYFRDYGDWQNFEPQLGDYADMTAYQAAHDTWEAMEPELSDGYYEVQAGAVRGDGSYVAVSYVPNGEGYFYDTDFYIDDRHYSNAPTEEELLNKLSGEWIDDIPHLDEEDWKEDGQDQYQSNSTDWVTHEPEESQYENGSDGNWGGCPDYEYVEPNAPIPPEPVI